MPRRPLEHQIREALRPHEDTFCQIIRTAWGEFRQHPMSASFMFSRTRANVVWDLIAQNALRSFVQAGVIDPIPRDQTYWFRATPWLIFRFKKADPDGFSRNIPTQTSLAFTDPQIDLPGIESVARADIVYILNEDETEISDIRVVVRNGDVIEIMYSIDAGPPSAEVVELPYQTGPQGPRVRISPKPGISRKSRDDKSIGKDSV